MAMEALQVLAWVIGLMIALFFLTSYQQYRTDLLRYRLFIARDKLFKQAQEGAIEFNSPAYGMTRTTINGMLRFAHEVNIFRILSYYLAYRFCPGIRRVDQYRDTFKENIEDLGMSEKKAVINALAEAHVAVAAHIFSTSILFFWWAMPLNILLNMLHKSGMLRRFISTGKKARRGWSVFDGEANCVGNPHLCQ